MNCVMMQTQTEIVNNHLLDMSHCDADIDDLLVQNSVGLLECDAVHRLPLLRLTGGNLSASVYDIQRWPV